MEDTYGHGTITAGIIAARDNSLDVIGVAPDVQLLSANVNDGFNGPDPAEIVCAIDAGRVLGVHVYNLSLSMQSSTGVIDAIRAATNDGAVVVVAANEETSASASRDRIVFHLRNIGIAPPPSLSITIEGAEPGYQNNYTFTAAVGGGAQGPYTYRWYRSADGGGYQDTGVTSQSYTAYYNPGSYTLRVDVTAPGYFNSAYRGFSVACNHQPCVF